MPHGGGCNGPRGRKLPDALLLSARSRNELGYRHLPCKHVVKAGLLQPLAIRGVQDLRALELSGLGVASTNRRAYLRLVCFLRLNRAACALAAPLRASSLGRCTWQLDRYFGGLFVVLILELVLDSK